jgi:hypothetical protein
MRKSDYPTAFEFPMTGIFPRRQEETGGFIHSAYDL